VLRRAPSDQYDKLLKETPLGYVEMRMEFGREGRHGRWLRTLNAVVRINGVLFMHGGVSPRTASMSCAAMNETIRREVTTELDKGRADPKTTLSASDDGPLWYRGLALEPDTFASTLDDILAKQRAQVIVIGHTVVDDGRIRTRFDGKVIQIDTGMQAAYVATGRASALEIARGVFTAIYQDRRDTLPVKPAETAAAAGAPAAQ
jgi:hypothetical protein